MLGVTAEYLCGFGFLGGLLCFPGSSDGQRVNESSTWYSRRKPPGSAPGLFPQEINLLGKSEKHLACSYFSLALLKLAIT